MASSRPRDSYRARVFDALDTVEHERFETWEALTFLDGVTRKVWYRNRAKDILGSKLQPALFFGAQSSYFCNPEVVRAAHEGDDATLTFNVPAHDRTDLTLLHALAHTMHPADTAWHGPEFAAVFLALIEHDLSHDRRVEVADAFRAAKVKTRTWNEKAREEAKARRAQEQLLAMYAELSTPLVTE